MALSVETNTAGEIAADPKGKAILDKVIPGMTTQASWSKVKGMKLKTISALSGGKLSMDLVKQVEAELKKL